MATRKVKAREPEKSIKANVVGSVVQRAGQVADWASSAGELLADESAPLADRRWALRAIGESFVALTRPRRPMLSDAGMARVFQSRFPDAPREVQVDDAGRVVSPPRLGASSVVAVFQRLSDEWREERRRSEDSAHRNTAGTPAATADADGEAVREILFALVDALQGTTGWNGIRRAHAALTGADRSDAARRRGVLQDVHWAMAVLPPQKTEEQRKNIAGMLLSGLRKHHSAFRHLSAAKTLAILDDRRPNTKVAMIAARLSVACKAFGYCDEDDAREAFRKTR